MDSDGTPLGGKWNYDHDNRKAPPPHFNAIKRLSHSKSDILKDVLNLVKDKFSHHFGSLEPFHYATTQQEVTWELDHFIDNVLPYFGDYQDAMIKEQPYLNHSLLSSYINLGLLLPIDVCKKAEASYHQGYVHLIPFIGIFYNIIKKNLKKIPVYHSCIKHGIDLAKKKKNPLYLKHRRF